MVTGYRQVTISASWQKSSCTATYRQDGNDWVQKVETPDRSEPIPASQLAPGYAASIGLDKITATTRSSLHRARALYNSTR